MKNFDNELITPYRRHMAWILVDNGLDNADLE